MSTVVGAVFAVIVMSSAVTYTGYSMNEITQLAAEIETKQVNDAEQLAESYEVITVRNDNNKFNMTLLNTGDLPVHINRLWVENTTDSSWAMKKYELDVTIPSGGSVKDIGQSLDLYQRIDQSYMLLLVSDRGNTQRMFVSGIADAATPIFLNLRATPSILPTTFETSVILEVINTGTTQLLNLVPNMVSTTPTCTSTCNGAVQVGTVYPASFDSLDPGDIATFEWIYTIQGDTAGDFVTFTAGLLNGVDTVQAVATIQPVPIAENSDVALESGGVADEASIDDSILLFHEETDLVPAPGYQMMSSDTDGGSSGHRLDMESYLAANPVSFFTNNGTKEVKVAQGTWNASLFIRSAPMPDTHDPNYDYIFHFEDGDGTDPDNSEGDSDLDLEECGVSLFQKRIGHDDDDAEEQEDGDVDIDGGTSSDHELVYDGGNGHQHIGLRWSLDVPKDAVINSADIRFRSDQTDTGTSPHLIIGAEDAKDPPTFTEAGDNDISDRWADVTTAQVVWRDIPGWSNGEEGADTTTPDLKSIVQEIVNRADWVSGDHIVFIIKDNSGGSNEGRRTAEHRDSGGPGQAARLTVNYGSTGSPDWRDGEGPHGSGAYYYDGISNCHRSKQGINDNESQLRPDDDDTTTALWFRTEFANQVNSEQMMFFMDENDGYPNADFYKISIGSQGDGRVEFAYDGDGVNNDVVSCVSVNEYDDAAWYRVTGVRDYSAEYCELWIHNLDGTLAEPAVKVDYNHPGADHMHANGKWYIGTANENSNYFNGLIDDVMHWNHDMLSEAEINALAVTNYGSQAHLLNVALNITDTDGNFVSGVWANDEVAIPFRDPKGYENWQDSAYTMYNVTMPISSITNVTVGNRLNFSMNFIPGDATWTPLDMDIKIDDTGFSDPYPSYLQTPPPNTPFQSYIVYDRSDELEFFLENSGTDGIYFVYTGTKAVFDDGAGNSYASYIKWVNGTGGAWEVDENEDSIYIPTGEVAWLHFWQNPTDRPCKTSGVCDGNGSIIPAGSYRVAVWVNGYSDQGETFGRSVVLGTITVTT